MKRILTRISMLTCLLAAAGCSQEGDQSTPVGPVGKDGGRMVEAKRTDIEMKEVVPGQDGRIGEQYTLTYSAGANGSIDGVIQQSVSRGDAGMTVTAIPADGYHFAAWSDGVTTASRTELNVTANLVVTASFALDQYNLVYLAGEHGTLAGEARQIVNHGSTGKPITATPEPGYHFTEWSDGLTNNPRTDANVTADLSVTASFTINQYTLNYTADDNGFITGPSQQAVKHGSDGSMVTAVAADGYHFVSWSDGMETPDRIDIGVRGNVAVTANFEINTYSVGGKVDGLAEGNELVLKNGEEDLIVNVNGDFAFAAALTDGSTYAVIVTTQPTSPNQTCTVSGGAGSIAGANVTDIQVECKYNVYTVGGTMSGLPDGNQLVLQNNKGDDLVVAANGTFVFASPLDDGSSYEVSIHSQQLKPKWFCSLEMAVGSLAGSNVTNVDAACFPEAELMAVPGLGKIHLSWNSQDFRGATFSLCRARQDVDSLGFDRCGELEDGILETKLKSPHTLSRLVNDIQYWLQLEIQHPGGRRTYSPVVTATPFAGLNDTGIDWCADNNNRNQEGTRPEKSAGCEAVAAQYPGQDAHLGRDAEARLRTLAKSGSGSAGFDFTKVCANGEMAGEGDCPPNPSLGSGPANWACVHDNVTGLVWEVKTTRGLRGQENLYSWYNPDDKLNGGVPGVQNGGRCEGSDCDTYAYVQEVNKQGLCGDNDWRLPTRKELLSIVDNGRYNPTIDSTYFPNTPAAYFWSLSSYADQPGFAWQVYFEYGEVLTAEKGQGSQVRVVRRDK